MLIKDINNEIQRLKGKRNNLIQNIKEEETDILKNGGTLLERPMDHFYPDEISVDEYKNLKNEIADLQFFERVKDKISNIPDSNGAEYFEQIDVRIGIIADEFLYNSFKNIAKFQYLTLDNYREHMDQLDVLLVGSAWKGLNEEWKGLANPNNTNLRSKVESMVNEFKEQGVMTVFYSKEDPTNYERFVGLAKFCDHIFTTAIEKIDDYKKDCNNENVHLLEFGVNPIYNNPIGMKMYQKDFDSFIFAGSWYKKYEKRQLDTKRIFNAVLAAGQNLTIVDRNFNLDNPKHLFPVNYLKYITPPIQHNDLQKVLKLFPWTINLNSIQDSETMFANRVYELQAMGNLIVSNYSLGVNNRFPNALMLFNENELKYISENVSNERLYEQQLEGIRTVLRNHTTYHRISDMLMKLGFDIQHTERSVAVVVKEVNENILENFNRQSYPNKTLITENELNNHEGSYDYVAFFNEKYFYGEYYLEDMINGFKYTNSDFITKDSYYEGSERIDGTEHGYVNNMNDKYKTVFSVKKIKLDHIIAEDFENRSGYSIDNQELDINAMASNKEQSQYKMSVIIPVYNNGKYLYNKCLFSLERSSMFNDMEIIIVDDGSTDEETLRIIKRVNRKYSNVKVYNFEDYGSGTASRPRNKGVELATTDYITYLDPDNEAVNDGYAKLYSELINNNVDMVVGNIVKVNSKETKLNYFNNVFRLNPTGYIEDTKDLLLKSNLKAQSIQALLVKKEVIVGNQLQMVVGAAGQDTLFFQELLINSNNIKAIDIVIHLYYAEVSNSVTNAISKNFFEKYLLLEKERIKFLKKNKLLNHYVNNRFESYFNGWYLLRVPRLKNDDYKEAIQVLYEIYSLYKPYIKGNASSFKKLEEAIKKEKYEKFIDYCRNL